MSKFSLMTLKLVAILVIVFSAVTANSIPDVKDELNSQPLSKDTKSSDIEERDKEVQVEDVQKIEIEEIKEVNLAEDAKEQKGSPTTKVIATFMGHEDDRVLYVDYGEKVGVTCGGNGDPAPFLRWYRRRTDVSSFWQRVGKGPFATFEILEDAVYICTARNVHNDFYDTVSSEQLTVKVKDHNYPELMHPDFVHSDKGFQESMDLRRPDNIHVAYLDSTIIVGVVLSLTIIILLAIITISYCRSGKYGAVRKNAEPVFQSQPPKYFGTNNDGYVPLRV